MATDVARLSFDPARLYRGVVPQQGRVSLEAEQNEQRVIDGTQRRLELIDIVGPVGTPDNGYLVSAGGVNDLIVGAGTMYVGGWRVELDTDLDAAHQPDWLDAPGGPGTTGPPAREHIVLLVQDTDVTAVEDPALYEVALGGPDGAARTRLLQRIVALPTEAGTCGAALVDDTRLFAAAGLDLDPKSMELLSTSRLLVTWDGPPTPPDPCEPTSVGGYLGAENQCIRVQITAVHDDGTFDFVWGYDDASFLYRVTADTSADPVLTLDRSPVDDYHRPRVGQAVQALRATAALRSTDGVVEGYVAALGGVLGVLAAPYDPDTRTVRFPGPLPADYLDPTANPQLYLRVWAQQVTGATIGTAVDLAGTGMRVTITAPHIDDFWCIAVRPATPTAVYPDRYLREPQPPDGPHQWICPLAVVEWLDGRMKLLADCRRQFRPLTEIDTGCCTVEVRPSDTGRLQTIIDAAVADQAAPVTICFEPGTYELAQPIVLGAQHDHLTLRGCNDGATLAVAAGSEGAFTQGMIVLGDTTGVTITGFDFTLPQATVSIAIRPIDCTLLDIEGCEFDFAAAGTGVAVFAAGSLRGFRLGRNRFVHDISTQAECVGYLHIPTALPTVASDITVADNEFRGLTTAVYVVAHAGEIRVQDNVITEGYGGIWLLDAAAFAPPQPFQAHSSTPLDPVLIQLAEFAAGYPLPAGDTPHADGTVETITAAIRVARNSVDCGLPNDTTTGPAAFVYFPLATPKGQVCALAVDANRLVSGFATVTAAVIGGTTATVNGNTVIGGGLSDQTALVVQLGQHVAITGNVVRGTVNLPTRPFPAPLDTWQPLNTIT